MSEKYREALLAAKAKAALIPLFRQDELNRRFLAAQKAAQLHATFRR
ncbi:hypothetical protein [Mycobacteroides abscessus]|nr:hypothetical protein [Mycobacteroides abscessus]